jgi:hypothetical protein
MAAGFCPGFSEWRVFSAGMKIVIDKNLEKTVWQCFFRVCRAPPVGAWAQPPSVVRTLGGQ